MGREGNPMGIVQEIKFDIITKCCMHKPEYILENETQKSSLLF